MKIKITKDQWGQMGLAAGWTNKMSDHYPAGMSDCDQLGLNGQCNDSCPRLASEEMYRFREECYTYKEYLKVKNKCDMSAVKHLEIEEEG